MGPGTTRIGQKYPIAKKLLKMYGEGGPNIGPSQTLVLDEKIRNKVMVNNLIPEEVQKVFANGNVVDK